MTNPGQQTSPADGRRRQVRVIPLVFAGGPSATAPFATDDTNFVNDQGQTSGDIFTQNAQDQN